MPDPMTVSGVTLNGHPLDVTLPERPLGLRVRDVREHRGLDYRTAAAELGIATGTLHRLENDGTLDPWLSTVRKVETWLEKHGPAPLAADRLPDHSPASLRDAWLDGYSTALEDTEARSAPPGPNGPVDPTPCPYPEEIRHGHT